MGSFVLQFNQDTTTTTNYPKIIAFFQKKSLEKILKPKRNMNYYFRSQNSSSNCGMIARKPKKSLKWADHNQEKPLQQIRFIDIVGKGKKLPRNNDNNIISKKLLKTEITCTLIYGCEFFLSKCVHYIATKTYFCTSKNKSNSIPYLEVIKFI